MFFELVSTGVTGGDCRNGLSFIYISDLNENFKCCGRKWSLVCGAAAAAAACRALPGTTEEGRRISKYFHSADDFIQFPRSRSHSSRIRPSETYSKSTNMPREIVNWEEALNQVGGDREFLDEVMQDLLSEADSAEKEIGDAIRAADYAVVMRAAHRIKGSASYLFCDILRNVSLQLQERGHEATNNPGNQKLQDEIDDLYDDYRKALRELKEEVAPRK